MRYSWFLLLLGAASAFSCSPEVVIARRHSETAAGGEAPSAGAGAAAGAGPATAGSGAVAASAGAGGEGGDESGAAGSDGNDPDPTSLILADSVADFGLEQGGRGWYYGFDTGTLDTFALLPRTSVITAYVPVSGDTWDCWTTSEPRWTQIFQLGAHPNGTDTSPPSTPAVERAVRRWISSYDGDVRIAGELAKIDIVPMGSNGVDALIFVDGVEVYRMFIAGDDAGGLSYEAGASVDIGSTVDFVLDAHEGNDYHDLTRFTAVIERAISQSG